MAMGDKVIFIGWETMDPLQGDTGYTRENVKHSVFNLDDNNMNLLEFSDNIDALDNTIRHECHPRNIREIRDSIMPFHAYNDEAFRLPYKLNCGGWFMQVQQIKCKFYGALTLTTSGNGLVPVLLALQYIGSGEFQREDEDLPNQQYPDMFTQFYTALLIFSLILSSFPSQKKFKEFGKDFLKNGDFQHSKPTRKMSTENEPLDNDDYQTNSYQNAGNFAASSFKNVKNFFNEKLTDFSSNNSTTNNLQTNEEKPRRREAVHLFCGDVDQDLLISKLFYLFFYAAFGSLFPLISIYFKQLGMNAVQASLLVGVRPFIEFASIPMWGFLADKYKKAKIMLIFSLLSWIGSTLILNYFHPLTPYCLVDNGTYATLQMSKVVYSTADNTDYDFSNIKLRNYQRPELYVEQNRTPGMSPVYLNRDIVDNYPRDVDDDDLVKPPFSTKVYRKSSVEQTFMLFFLIIVIGEFCSAPAITLADACTLSYLGDHPEFYGKQRMFGSIGWAVAMFIIGIALDHSLVFSSHPCGQTDLHEKNYTTCFAAFSVLMGCALLISFLFRFDNIKTQRPDKVSKVIMDIRQTEISHAVAENARARAPEPQEAAGGRKWMSVLKTFGSAPHAAFLFVAWWFGFGVGLVFCFLFWHLQDIGGSPTLYGFASVINHSSEIFAYFFSYRLINTYGHMKVLYIGLLANVFRFLYVSWLTDPWWVLPFEFVQGITHAAVWAAATSYISLAAPPQYKSSAQGLLQNLHHAIGRASGTRFAFQFYGWFCAIILAAFYAINRLMKVSGFKYQSEDFEDELTHAALDPHGIPMMVPYSKSEEKLAQIDNVGAYYGATDATQEAYDRYVHEPYDKPNEYDYCILS
uniref:Major facilitator superfamily associated domain-containing protein n=1 Tax=Romanomermis culicivorax TaxID=13658 RepID=A0A915ILP9_ROMCU